MKSLRKYLAGVCLLALAGCGSQGLDAGGGGNVGFGGAQDIGQFRDLLDRGLIPGADTLDANGFFNEHYTELPPADCGQDLCLHGMVSANPSWLDESDQTVLRVALNTVITPEDLEPKPLDLVVVIDTSGSMAQDDRMRFVKQGMDLLIGELGEDDRLGLVTYATEGSVQAELEELTPLGGTNIYEGLELGMQMAANNLSLERQTRVILLSDGNITSGLGPDQVSLMSEGYVADGIGLTTIGVGDNFNLDLMRGLAERGSGNFYYVEDPTAVVEVFTEELNYFSQPIALGLEIEVESANSYRLGEVVGTRLWETDGGETGGISVPALFLSSRVDAEPEENGRRGGGSSLYIAMERVPGAVVGETLATVRASYRLPGSDERISQEIEVVNAVGDELPETGYVSHVEMLKAYAVYNFYLGLREACVQAEWDYNQSLQIVRTLQASATEWNTRVPDADISDDMALLAQFESNLVAQGANDYGDGYDDDYYGDDWEGRQHCSASGSSASSLGFAFLLLGFIASRRRRSRS
jgi:Ca-activated chloride channel family protein